MDPVQVVGHFGVDAQLVQVPAALSPGHQAQQEPGVSVERDHGPAAVPLAGVHALAHHPGTQHVPRDVVAHVSPADVPVHHRDLDDVEGRAEPVAPRVLFAPAAHHRHGAVALEDLLGQAASRQADGDDVVGQRGGAGQPQQADVVVRRPAVVLWVSEGLGDLQGDLGAFATETLVVACQRRPEVRTQVRHTETSALAGTLTQADSEGQAGVQAVGGGQDPALIDQDASTVEPPRGVQQERLRTRQHAPAHTSTRTSTHQHTATRTSTRQHTPAHTSTRQHAPAHGSTHQHTPTRTITRQHAPKHTVTLVQVT